EDETATMTEESQHVELVKRSFAGRQPVRILGRVSQKLVIRPELKASNRSAIRQATEEAEKARTARRIQALDHVHNTAFLSPSQRSQQSQAQSRKIESANLLSETTTASANIASRNAPRQKFAQLEEGFGRRFQEYTALNRWIDNRLAVFSQLKAQVLTGAKDPKLLEQLAFKVTVEQSRLQQSSEYRETLERLNESYAALLMLKKRMK
ncbi:unnamed protein product, partial [Sphagnum compactum]